MKKRNISVLLSILIILGIIIFIIFFDTNKSKNMKIGNNSTSQEIVDYILNISSYEATVEIEVNSNKNNNKYKLKQQYQSPDISIQEVLEPSNIAGVKITRNNNELKIENTSLSLNTVFENYDYISDNILDLSNFISDYKADEKANWVDENNQIIMKCNKEKQEKILFIDKTGKPIKLEIRWTNKKENIYILYNEVNINSLN